MNNDLSHLSEDAPLLHLIERPLHEMSSEELREHTQKLRELSSSANTIRTKIKAEGVGGNKVNAKTNVTKAKAQASKYLDMIKPKGGE